MHPTWKHMADRRGSRLLNHCMFPEPEIKESIIETESFSSTLSPVFSLFFFGNSQLRVGPWLPALPPISPCNWSERDVPSGRLGAPWRWRPLPHGRDRKASVCLSFPAKPRGNIPVLFVPIVSYDIIKCLRRLILAAVCRERRQREKKNNFSRYFSCVLPVKVSSSLVTKH